MDVSPLNQRLLEINQKGKHLIQHPKINGFVKILLFMRLIISNEEEGLIYFAMSYYL